MGSENSFQAKTWILKSFGFWLRKFFKNFPKLRSKFRNFITIFIKKLKFLTRFHIGQSFANHWCLNWFLQNLANAFSSGEKICWKWTIKNFSTTFKKKFFDWFLSKVNHDRTPLFFGVSHGEHVSKVIKLSIFEKKSKITKKFVENHHFLEKIWFLWLQLLRIFGGLYMRLPYVLLWLLGEKVQDVWFCGNFSENVTRDVFCQAYTWYPKFFYVKKTKIFKLWFLAQKVFKMA